MEQNQTPEVTTYSKIGQNVKITVRPAGAPAPSAPAPVSTEPLIKRSQPTVRYQANGDGTGVLMTSAPTLAKVAAGPSTVQATATNSNGQRIPLSLAGMDDVIDLGGSMGATKASIWLQMGELVKLPGGGFARPGQEQNAATPKPNEQKPNEQAPQDQPVTASDLANVVGTTDAEEAILRDVRENVPAQFEGMIEKAARGQEIDYDGMARDMGVEGGAGIEQMVAAHRNAGIQVLRNIDPTIDPLAFEAYVQKNPDLASNIVRDMLKKDPSSLVKAGRAYVADRVNRIEQKAISMGVETKRGQDGKLYIARSAVGLQPTPRRGDFPADNWISLDQAVREGHVEING